MEGDRGTDDRSALLGADDRPRAGWAEQLALMAERGDDRLLDEGGPATAWDEIEWEW